MMARWGRSVRHRLTLANAKPPGPEQRGLRLSGPGRVIALILALPGVAALVVALLLPGLPGMVATSTITSMIGLVTIFGGPRCGLMYAHWDPRLRRERTNALWGDASRLRPDGGRLAVTVGVILAALNLAGAVAFGLLARDEPAQFVPAALYLVVAVGHGAFARSRRTAAIVHDGSN